MMATSHQGADSPRTTSTTTRTAAPMIPGTITSSSTPLTARDHNRRFPECGRATWEYGREGALSMTTELSVRFSGGPYAAASARRALGSLRDLVGPKRLDDVCLLVSELVTNGVRHAG